MSLIYQITDIASKDCYIGTTTTPINQRVRCHKSDAKTRPNVGCSLRYFDFNNIDVVVLEEGLSLKTAKINERQYIETTPNCINARKKSSVSIDELLKDPSLARKVKLRKDKTTCDCGITVSRYNLNRHLKSQYHLNSMETN
jgi:hypothetical protein